MLFPPGGGPKLYASLIFYLHFWRAPVRTYHFFAGATFATAASVCTRSDIGCAPATALRLSICARDVGSAPGDPAGPAVQSCCSASSARIKRRCVLLQGSGFRVLLQDGGIHDRALPCASIETGAFRSSAILLLILV